MNKIKIKKKMELKNKPVRYEVSPILKYGYSFDDLREYKYFSLYIVDNDSTEDNFISNLDRYKEYLAIRYCKYDLDGNKIIDEKDYFISCKELEDIFNNILNKIKDYDVLTIHDGYKYEKWKGPADYLYYQGKLYEIETPLLGDFNDSTCWFPEIIFNFILGNKITNKSEFKEYYSWVDNFYIIIPKQYYDNIYYLERSYIEDHGFLKIDRDGKILKEEKVDFKRYKTPTFKLTDKNPVFIFKSDTIIINFTWIWDTSTIVYLD